MAKNRKPKNKVIKPVKNAAFASFDKACRIFFNKLGLLKQYNLLSKSEKRIMFDHRFIMRTPVSASGTRLPSKELKKIGNCVQKKMRAYSLESDGQWYSNYEMQIFYLLGRLKTCKLISEKRREELVQIFGPKNVELDGYFYRYYITLLKATLSLSSIESKYYSFYPRSAKVIEDKLEIEISLQVFDHRARKKYIKRNGVHRPAYAIGLPNSNLKTNWLKADVSFLKGKYKGDQEELEVYIQAHALKRMKERLDVLDPSSFYYIIWSSTIDMDNFVLYGDLILYPIKVHDSKVGYFVAEVIDDCLILKTFLFVTHSSTPEGDKLKEISGLGWKDISYWKIDRLSTFMKTDTEKYPRLTAMFKEVGLGDLYELKGKEFDLDTMQDANLDALRDYISKGKEEVSMLV
ncbi:hypothetical protein [Marinifilum flexuosum]|uniref:Uncharacterized protein n=1 Tax=Marinifilum flexuosum TaxID=1117708 RepID=A0A419X2P4_9BACT|nr:hypothetical protein [Marinifilum flexuosum]RKE02016.1 hypothetical protein BXY64_2096 [Marinifilum flexuosum]